MVKSQPKNKVVADALCITETERKVLFLLNKDRDVNYSVVDIKENLKLDRTTVQKCILRLKKKGLLKTRQINLDRGFMFVYTISEDIPNFKDYVEVKLFEKHNEDFRLLEEVFEDE